MDDQQMNADKVIEQLTSKNFELEEQIKQHDEQIQHLKLDIHELEQLHQMDEEIIEIQKESERELQQKNQELVLAIATLNQQVAEQESQLESQLHSEEIIAALTQKNLDLEEQNKNLRQEVQELEQLHQMDEEIGETQRETEKELLLRNEEQMMAIATLKKQLTEWEGRAAVYEHAIIKFRQKTADLNEEVQTLRDELARMREEEMAKARAAGAEISLLATVNRQFAEIVEAELNAIELKSARFHIENLRRFMPDNFSKAGGDNDCLIMCVLFPRLSEKAAALAQLLQQKFPQAPDGLRREHCTLSHKGEQWAHIRHFGYQLQQLRTVLHKFIAVFNNCSAERLSRLAVQQMDTVQRETRLEQYFKLLQTNRFDENTSIGELEQIVKYFQRLFSTNLSTEQYNGREDLRNTLVQIKEGFAWIHFNAQRLRHYLIDSPTGSTALLTSSSSSGIVPNSTADPMTASMHSSLMAKSMTASHASNGQAAEEFTGFVDRLGQLLAECEQLAMRALNRIPAENELILTAELNESLPSAIAALEKCGSIVQQCCSLASSQLSAVDSEGLPAQQMLEFVLSSVEKFVGQVDGHRRAHSVIFTSLEEIKSVLDKVSEALDNSSMEIPAPNKQPNHANDFFFPPLMERAHTRKQDAVEAEGLRWQVTKKDEELLKLQRALKGREQDIGTIKLRLEMAEKQLAEAGGGVNAEIQKLTKKCTDLEEELKQQKGNYEQELEQLKAQLADSEVKKRVFSQKALFAVINLNNIQNQQKQQAQHQTTAMTAVSPTDSAGSGAEAQQVMAVELSKAQEKIRMLESQNLSDSSGANALIAAMGCAVCAERNRTEQDELKEMLQEADTLMRDSDMLLKPRTVREWIRYREAAENINFRTENLRNRIRTYWRKYRPGQQMPQLLLALPKVTVPNLTSAAGQNNTPTVAAT